MPVSFYPVAAFFPKPMKDSFYERVHEVSSFDEKISLCLEHIIEFSNVIKKDHDAAKCTLDYCEIKLFSENLYDHVHGRRQSPRLLRKNVFDLCNKYPQGFDGYFQVTKNKNVYYFSKFAKEN